MRGFWCVLVAASLLAQNQPGGGLVRGVLVPSEASPDSFAVLTPSGQVWRFHYDARTWIERDHQRATIRDFRPAEKLEVVCDRIVAAPSVSRYARMVHALLPAPVFSNPLSQGLYRMPRRPAVQAMEAEIGFSGIAEALAPGILRLRSRSGAVNTFILNSDTSYSDTGRLVSRGALTPGMPVFVRAVRNIQGEWEALQVVWGEIFRPN